MTNIKTLTQIKVRYAETDQMGVVHHGNYAQYFEIGRLDWLSKLGFSYKKMEDEGIMLPVIDLKTTFLKSAFFDETLTLKTTLVNIPRVKIEFEYEVTNEKEEILTLGSTILVFMSAQSRRPIKCPSTLLEAIETYSDTTDTP